MRTLAIPAVVALLCGSAQAQTMDHFYRSWAWWEEVGSARAAGLGGSAVALDSEAGAIAWNPGIAGTMKRPEILAGAVARSGGDGRLGDTTSSRMGIGFVGGAGLITPTIALGGFLIEPHAQNWTLAGTALPDGTSDSGFLRTVVTEAGGVVAWRPSARVSLGLAVLATHLEGEGEWLRRSAGAASAGLHVGTSSGSTKVVGSIGVLLHASDTLALGFSLSPRVNYTAERTAVTYDQGPQSPSGYALARPGRMRFGASWRAHRQVLVVAQADYVSTGQPEYYEDTVEPRAGIEVSLPTGAMSLQLRGGVHYEGRSGLNYADSWVFATRDRRVRPSCGASLVARRVRIDVAGELSDRPIVTMTGGVGF